VTVQTLDEIVLIFRRDSGSALTKPCLLSLYGTDICMRARSKVAVYAISAFCVHIRGTVKLPDEFYACYSHINDHGGGDCRFRLAA